jgi:hypothetical protein
MRAPEPTPVSSDCRPSSWRRVGSRSSRTTARRSWSCRPPPPSLNSLYLSCSFSPWPEIPNHTSVFPCSSPEACRRQVRRLRRPRPFQHLPASPEKMRRRMNLPTPFGPSLRRLRSPTAAPGEASPSIFVRSASRR